jgi:hypothetical protein
VFITAITPDEFVHAFAGHHDTKEHFHSANDINISDQHVHCKSLQDNLPAYKIASRFLFEEIPTLSIEIFSPELFAEHFYHFHFSSRGPPALIS